MSQEICEISRDIKLLMSADFLRLDFSQQHFSEFKRLLYQETEYLLQLLREEEKAAKKSENWRLGLQLEAWLIDNECQPVPERKFFVIRAGPDMVVHELSKYCIELHVGSRSVAADGLSAMHSELKELWRHCQGASRDLGASVLQIGVLPTLKEEALHVKGLSDPSRFQMLNRQILTLQKNLPRNVELLGLESADHLHETVALEAAATSLQVHLQVGASDACHAYNASLLASAPCVAIAANSPYLFQESSWDESRVAVLENMTETEPQGALAYAATKQAGAGKYIFGNRFLTDTLGELFVENLELFPGPVPVLFDDSVSSLSHLRFHNGTIWRWTRPTVEMNEEGVPRFGLEQNSMSTGPSLVDVVANCAFYLGLVQYYTDVERVIDGDFEFSDCRTNYYTAAQYGLNAIINWKGRRRPIQEVILKEFLPQARRGLRRLGAGPADVDFYLGEIVQARVTSGQNGANWQRLFVERYGTDFKALTEVYQRMQETERPVHEWTL